MLEKQIDQAERLETLRNDLSVQREQRERAEPPRVFAEDQSLPRQATTMLAFAQADAAEPRGRFSAVSAAYVVGSKAEIAASYPAAAAHQADPVGQEPSLGYRIDAMPEHEPLEVSFPSPQATDPTSARTVPPVDAAGVGSFSFRRRTL